MPPWTLLTQMLGIWKGSVGDGGGGCKRRVATSGLRGLLFIAPGVRTDDRQARAGLLEDKDLTGLVILRVA